MRNKEDMSCFKYHKDDRICWICEHEDECIIELEIYNFVDNLYFMCPHKDDSSYYLKCKRTGREGLGCADLDKSVMYECHYKEIEIFKRKLKLEKLKKIQNENI